MKSIITKLIMVCVVLLIFVGGIVVANLGAFRYIENVLITIIDEDVTHVIENARLSREISQVFAETNLLISTFIDQPEYLSTEGERLLEILGHNISASSTSSAEQLRNALREFTDRLQALFDQGVTVNDMSQTIETLHGEIATQLITLEKIVAEKMIRMIMEENEEKIFEIEQLDTMIPGYRDMLSQIAILLTKLKQVYLGEEDLNGSEDRKQQIVALLKEFSINLATVTKTGQNFAPAGKQLNNAVIQYEKGVEVFYQEMNVFQNQVTHLNAAQEELLAEMGKIDAQIVQTTSKIRGEASSAIHSSRNLVVYLSIVILVVLIGVGYYIFRLVNPLKTLANTAGQLAEGAIMCKLPPSKSHDEIGTLSQAFKKLIRYIQRMAAAATEIARGDLSGDIQPQSDLDVLGNAFRDMSLYLHDMASVARAVAEGDLTETVPVRSSSDAFGQMIQTMTESLHSLIIQIRSCAEEITSTGTAIASLSSHDIDLVKHVSDSIVHVVSTMNEMSVSVENVAHSMETLSSSVEETSTSISQMASTVESIASNTTALRDRSQQMGRSLNDTVQSLQEVVDSTDASQQLAQETIQDAFEGQQAVEQVVTSMSTIQQTVTTAVEAITRFERRSREIGTILEVIREITEQTSLLALNASIIAAQAGTHGRGFAVVAEEIKTLANGVGTSTKNIAEIVNMLQAETSQIVQTIYTGAENVEQGIEHTRQAQDTLKKILSSTQRSSAVVTEITEVLHALMTSSGNISFTMEQVNTMTEQITFATAEHQASASQISQAIEDINDRASQIQLETDQQATGIRQVLEAAHDVALLIDQNLQSSRDISRTTEVLASQADILLHSVDRFKLRVH